MRIAGWGCFLIGIACLGLAKSGLLATFSRATAAPRPADLAAHVNHVTILVCAGVPAVFLGLAFLVCAWDRSGGDPPAR
jgi:hypothetical protein